MVNEIGGIGFASAAQGLAQASPFQPGLVRDRAEVVPSSIPTEKSELSVSRFAALATVKEQAVQVAQSARAIGQSLEQAGEVLDRISDEVKLVKNYPPYPPGNEQRQQFINSLNGLRRQLEAMAIPPLDKGMEPVFYPKETALSELDPVTATDTDVAAFASSVADASRSLERGARQLADQLDKSQPVIGDLPRATFSDSEARQLVESLADQLRASVQTTLGASGSLTRI